MKKVIKIISIICLVIILFMISTIIYAMIKKDGNLAMGTIMSLMMFSIMVWVILAVSKKIMNNSASDIKDNN